MVTRTLPLEIILSVLCRLTVKDLLRCRSVCRSWRSLIDCPDFIKLHLNHSIETSSNFGLVLHNYDLGLCWLDLDTLHSPIRLNQIQNGIEILGCCNGVLALASDFGNMALFNPSTRKCRKMRLSDITELPLHELYFGATGFRYDSVNDDYKLFRVFQFRNHGLSEAKLYSVKAKAWKKVNDFPYAFFWYQHGHGVFVNGALHWFVSQKQELDSLYTILAFDLVTENYSEVPPPGYYKEKGFYVQVGEFGGWLSVVKNYDPDVKNSDRVEIWVMKEYGVGQSWTMLFSVVPSNVTGSFSFAQPVAYLKSTDQVVLDLGGEKFVLYDLEKKRTEGLRIYGVPKFWQAHFCVGSLVGFDGEKVARKQTGENGNKIKKHKKQLGEQKRDDFLSVGFKLVL